VLREMGRDVFLLLMMWSHGNRYLISGREWFTRAWVVQESAMATFATVVLGSFERDWSDFGVAAMFFAFKAYSGPVHGMSAALDIVHGLWGPSRLASPNMGFQPRPPLLLLWLTHGREASNARDMVYALLGLADEEEAFRTDYAKSEKEIFSRVAAYLLRHPNPKIGHPLALLSGVKHYKSIY
jgi:hypothetical protein